jgi:hypothetical protein
MEANTRWHTLTEPEKQAYQAELHKAHTDCENLRLQFREYKLRPMKGNAGKNVFSVEVERAKVLDMIAWKYEQAFVVYDKLLVKHTQGV